MEIKVIGRNITGMRGLAGNLENGSYVSKNGSRYNSKTATEEQLYYYGDSCTYYFKCNYLKNCSILAYVFYSFRYVYQIITYLSIFPFVFNYRTSTIKGHIYVEYVSSEIKISYHGYCLTANRKHFLIKMFNICPLSTICFKSIYLMVAIFLFLLFLFLVFHTNVHLVFSNYYS